MGELGIGERLRNAREARGLSLDALERLTHVRAVYLQALEEEQFARLPGRVYVRGFLRTYAAAVGLDPDRLLEAYPRDAGSLPAIGVPGVEVPIRPAVRRSRLRRSATYAGLVLVSFLVIVAILGYIQLRQFGEPVPPQSVSPPPPSVRGPAQPIAPPPRVPELPSGELEAERPRPVEPVGGVNVELRATGTSWVRVEADGERLYQGLVEEGDVRRWHARQRLTIRVGNAPAVEVRINGQPVEPPPRRQVWERTFEAP